MTLAAWVHDWSPIAFRLGPLPIRWYGMSYAAGFLVAWLLLRWLTRRGVLRIAPERVGDVVLTGIVGVVLGGRLGYALFYKPSLFWTFSNEIPWWDLLAVNHGGMSSHGGILGVIIAAFVIARGPKNVAGERPHRVPVLHVLDGIVLIAPAGLLLGRVANFINGELLGRIVALPGEPAPWWSVKFPQELLGDEAPPLTSEQAARLDALAESLRRPGDIGGYDALVRIVDRVQNGDEALKAQIEPLLAARYPSQLFQGAAEGLLVAAVVWFVARRPRIPGVVGAWFLISYGVLRVATEFWRLPDSHLVHQRILGLSRGQWLSVPMIVVGVIGLMRLRRSRTPPMGGWQRPAATTAPESGR